MLRTENIDGALISYQSFFVKGSTLRARKQRHTCITVSLAILKPQITPSFITRVSPPDIASSPRTTPVSINPYSLYITAHLARIAYRARRTPKRRFRDPIRARSRP
jgi:hypothetical protein